MMDFCHVGSPDGTGMFTGWYWDVPFENLDPCLVPHNFPGRPFDDLQWTPDGPEMALSALNHGS